MPSIQGAATDPTASAAQQAVLVASRRNHRRRAEIAQETGLGDRQLRRILGGASTSIEQCRALLTAYGIPPTIALLLAELGHPDLIGTDEQDFLARFIPTLVDLLKERPRSINPKWATYVARHIDERLYEIGLAVDQRLVEQVLGE